MQQPSFALIRNFLKNLNDPYAPKAPKPEIIAMQKAHFAICIYVYVGPPIIVIKEQSVSEHNITRSPKIYLKYSITFQRP